MKRIKLTRGLFAVVDDKDFLNLSGFTWYANVGGRNFYAMRNIRLENGKRKTIRMHREIMGETTRDIEIDHIDGNGLNNQRGNLRFCSKSQNAMNVKLRRDNKSGFKGVSWNTKQKRWIVQLSINKKQQYLGSFSSKEEAFKVFEESCIKFHCEFAKIA